MRAIRNQRGGRDRRKEKVFDRFDCCANYAWSVEQFGKKALRAIEHRPRKGKEAEGFPLYSANPGGVRISRGEKL